MCSAFPVTMSSDCSRIVNKGLLKIVCTYDEQGRSFCGGGSYFDPPPQG